MGRFRPGANWFAAPPPNGCVGPRFAGGKRTPPNKSPSNGLVIIHLFSLSLWTAPEWDTYPASPFLWFKVNRVLCSTVFAFYDAHKESFNGSWFCRSRTPPAWRTTSQRRSAGWTCRWPTWTAPTASLWASRSSAGAPNRASRYGVAFARRWEPHLASHSQRFIGKGDS